MTRFPKLKNFPSVRDKINFASPSLKIKSEKTPTKIVIATINISIDNFKTCFEALSFLFI